MTIRRLTPDDAEAFLTLRRAALRHAPLAFLSSEQDDRFLTSDAVGPMLSGETGSITFGAFDPALVGIAGLFREARGKVVHKAHVWGMYVDPARRGVGLGADLLEAVLDHARTLPGITAVHLGVTSAAPAARKVYERAGFRVWGTEPEAIRYEGTSVDEHHMVLPL